MLERLRQPVTHVLDKLMMWGMFTVAVAAIPFGAAALLGYILDRPPRNLADLSKHGEFALSASAISADAIGRLIDADRSLVCKGLLLLALVNFAVNFFVYATANVGVYFHEANLVNLSTTALAASAIIGLSAMLVVEVKSCTT